MDRCIRLKLKKGYKMTRKYKWEDLKNKAIYSLNLKKENNSIISFNGKDMKIDSLIELIEMWDIREMKQLVLKLVELNIFIIRKGDIQFIDNETSIFIDNNGKWCIYLSLNE